MILYSILSDFFIELLLFNRKFQSFLFQPTFETLNRALYIFDNVISFIYFFTKIIHLLLILFRTEIKSIIKNNDSFILSFPIKLFWVFKDFTLDSPDISCIQMAFLPQLISMPIYCYLERIGFFQNRFWSV